MHKVSNARAALLWCAPLLLTGLVLVATRYAGPPQAVPGSVDGPDTPIVIHTRAGQDRARPDQALALLRDDNSRRRTAGMGPLLLVPQLSGIAGAHALDMIARGYFGHDTPEGVGPFQRMKAAGWQFGYAGENMAIGPDEVRAEQALYASPEHLANTLEPHYTKVGIAAYNTPVGEIFVEDFSD